MQLTTKTLYQINLTIIICKDTLLNRLDNVILDKDKACPLFVMAFKISKCV